MKKKGETRVILIWKIIISNRRDGVNQNGLISYCSISIFHLQIDSMVLLKGSKRTVRENC